MIKNRIEAHTWHWILGVLLLAPIQLAAKGCDSAVVGDDTEIGGAGNDSSTTQAGNSSTRPDTAVGGSGGATSTTLPRATGGSTESNTRASKSCGGLTGAVCGAREYCSYPVDAQCGAADQTGTCTAVPEICTLEYAPVCGCDGKTYGNACDAAAHGISVAANGECAKEPSGGNACGGMTGLRCGDGQYCNYPTSAQCGAADQTGTCTDKPSACDDMYQPVCGCDDKTYGNACEAASAGISVASSGECAKDPTSGTSCGGLTGRKCADGQYCNYPTSAQCGAADQTGSCTDKPEVCFDIYQPVCGCDGKTYGNACAAASAGISVASSGECAKEPTSGTSCGGLAGQKCADGQYCNYPTTAQCGAADQTGTCTTIPSACTKEYLPVCGCDDKTYGNACMAANAGVSVATDGACAEQSGSGTNCGGIAALKCPTGQYCSFPTTTRCGSGDQTGKCASKPSACTREYAPVCGCDGKTYGNACSAAADGVSVASSGECT